MSDPATQPSSEQRRSWRWPFSLLATLRLAVIVILLVVLSPVIAPLVKLATHLSPFAPVEHHERTVLEVLRSEELLFLVTNRVVTRVDVEMNEHSLLAGGRQGFLLATVKLYYGIDLKGVTAEQVHETKEAIVIDLAKPRLLDFAVDADWRYLDKKTGMWVVMDWFSGRDVEKELREQLKESAINFAKRNELTPDADAVLARLNRYAQALSARVGKRVEFRYVE